MGEIWGVCGAKKKRRTHVMAVMTGIAKCDRYGE